MDRKRFGDGKALAPIFGKKKPRQALLAHPNNSQTRTAPASSYGGQNVPYEQNQAGGFGFKKSTVPSQPRIVPNSGTMQHTTPDQHSGAMTQSRPGQHSSFVPQSRPLQPQSRPLQPQSRPLQPQSRPFPPQSRPLHQGGNMGQSRTPQQGGTVTQSRPGQSLHQRGIMPPARQVQVNGMMSDRSSGMPVTPRSTRPQQREEVQMSPMAGHQAWGSPAKPPQSRSQFAGVNYDRGTQPIQSVHGSQVMKPIVSVENGTKSDTSLRVLTSTVATLQRWSQYKQKINLMFEIFGVLNSAVLTPDRATAKEFMLKDDTGVIKCIFYQIDRDLSRMTRGRLYRCVGTLDVNTTTLKCVSVRPTSVEERDRSKMFVSASDAAMVEWVKWSREM